jgi:hypothetical protein
LATFALPVKDCFAMNASTIGFQPPCPHCGEKTYPTSKQVLMQAGELLGESKDL